MVASNATQGVVVLSAFFLPILAYVFVTRSQKPKNTAGPLPPPTEITALFIHPIKSCHGISVSSAKLLPTGLDLGMYISQLYQNSKKLSSSEMVCEA